MTNTKVAGLDIDFIDICIEELREGNEVKIVGCEDPDELRSYLADEDVMTTAHIRGDVLTLIPIN